MSDVLQRLAALLPPDRLLTRPEQLAAYESDGLTAYRTRPLAVAIPETTDEVIALVRFCHKERLPFVARGSGTSLSGGSLPVADGIVIALNRLTRILRLDPAQRIAVVEPGVVNTQVSLAAAPHRLHYAPDPSSALICTIGGNVAFNSGGAHCLKYGMTANHILGIKAVLATGEVVEWGGSSRENVGPDWCGLFNGNEGLFGIALEITLQLLPRAECFHTVLAGYRTLEQAGDAVSAVIASGLLPGAIEIMDALALEAAVAAVHAEYPPGARPSSSSNSKARAKPSPPTAGASMPSSPPASPSRCAPPATPRSEWPSGRAARAPSAPSAGSRPTSSCRTASCRGAGSARPSAASARWRARAGLRVANVFHAGDGNLHPLILFDGRETGRARTRRGPGRPHPAGCASRWAAPSPASTASASRSSNTCPAMYNADEMDCMMRLRAAFDPLSIANPGKKFPRRGRAPACTSAELHPAGAGGRAVISRE